MSRIANTGPFGILPTAIAPMLFALACTSDAGPNALPQVIREIPTEMSIAVADDVGSIGCTKPESHEESGAKPSPDLPRRRAAVVRHRPSGADARADVAPMEHAHLAVERLRSAPSANVPYRLVPRHATSMRLREHAPVSARTGDGVRSAIVIDMER
jgi:hypothetical protein